MNELPREKVKGLKNNIFFFVTIGVIILLALMFLGIKYLTVKKEKENVVEPPVVVEEKETEEEIEQKPKEKVSKIPNLTLINNEEAKVSMTIYKEGDRYCTKREELTCKEAAFTFLVVNENARILDVNNEYILYIDDILKIYDIGTKEKYQVNLENTYTDYKLVMNDNKIAGIIYYAGLTNYGFRNKYSVSGFYDLNYDKKRFENTYDFFTLTNSGKYIVGNKYNAFESNNSVNISFLEIENNNILFQDNRTDYNNVSYEIVDNNFIAAIGGEDYALYSLNGKEITKNAKQGLWTVSKKYLYVVLNNELLKYDLDGDFISKEDASNVYNLIKSYKVVNKDGFLYVLGLDSDYSKKVIEMTDEYIYSRLKSDYTTRNDREAFYLVLLSKNEGTVGYEVTFTLNGKKITKTRLKDNEYYHEYFVN